MLIENRISGKTRLIGLIGNPVEHSVSPQLHNTISAFLDVDLVYVPFRVENSDLEDAVLGLKALNLLGFNVTIPYKKDVMKFIDDNTKEALLMGAVNTVKNIDGRLYGYNTDAEGFSRSFKESAGTGFKDKNVFIIGAGGAARAIAVKIAVEGAKSICIVNRTPEKASDIVQIINNNISKVADYFSSGDPNVRQVFKESDIVINTSSIGMYPDIECSPVIKGCAFNSSQIVYDVIYNPSKTRFLAEAEKKGCKIINGLGMLFYQGIYAYEIWTGVRLPENITKELFTSFVNILPIVK